MNTSDEHTVNELLDLLVKVSQELTAHDIVDEILCERKGLVHETNPLLIEVNNALKKYERNYL
jgi:hypothetical protein